MTITNFKKWAAVAVCAICTPLVAQAVGTITLGGPLPSFRTASLGSADAIGYTGSGNATAAIVTGHTGGAAWTEVGSVAGGSGGPGTYINGGLTVVVTSGNWGDKGPLSGTWTINNANFWTTYGDAAISLHVGNGGGGPDHFVWVLTDFGTTGNWSYNGTGLGGGGLSNLKLYGRGTGTTPQPSPVPEGGTTVALLGLALCGLGLVRSRLVKA